MQCYTNKMRKTLINYPQRKQMENRFEFTWNWKIYLEQYKLL